MAIIDDIYANVDDFGLISSTEARELGVDNQELVRQAYRGKLERVARGVYRMPVWPYQEAAPYAIAVKAAGQDAYLYGESVIAILNLVPTNPNVLWIASPNRIRKNLGKGVHVLDLQPESPTTYYEGVPCQPLEQALRCAIASIGPERAARAAEEAVRLGYLGKDERERMGRFYREGGAPRTS